MSETPGQPPAVALTQHPCLGCGACCTRYRVSFYWGETDAAPGGTVPADLTEPLTPFRAMMKGTGDPKCRRCIALVGEVGSSALCGIHPLRPSVCREFSVSWENGERNERCDECRIAAGLEPLQPWILVPEGAPDDDSPPPPIIPFPPNRRRPKRRRRAA